MQRFDLYGKTTEVERLILLTKHDQLPTDEDGCIVVDIDLSISGQSVEDYDQYETAINKEYPWLPEKEFWQGRRDFLRTLMSRDSIKYYTMPIRIFAGWCLIVFVAIAIYAFLNRPPMIEQLFFWIILVDGAVSVSNSAAEVSIRADDSKINLENLSMSKGLHRVQAGDPVITAQQITGSMKIGVDDGNVTLTQIQGNLDITSDDATIDIDYDRVNTQSP